MPGRAAGGDLDRGEAPEICFGDVRHLVEKDPAGVERDAPFDCFADRARLLVNLFEHEMFEAALFRLDWIPGDPLHLRLDLSAREVSDAHRVPGHDGNLAVTEKENIARVFQDRGNVGSDKVLAVADTDYDWRSKSRGDDGIGLVSREHRQRKDAAQFADRLAHRLFKTIPLLEVLFDQVSYDLGVGFSDEVMILLAQ